MFVYFKSDQRVGIVDQKCKVLIKDTKRKWECVEDGEELEAEG